MKISQAVKIFIRRLSRIGCMSGAVASVLVIFCSLSFAQSQPTPVQWAGVSFVGDAATVHQVLPISFGLTQNPAFAAALGERLTQILDKIKPSRPDLKIVTAQLLEQGDDSYALSFAIAGENVDTQQIDSKLYSYYELQALVLLLNISKDPHRQRVVSSYPVRIRWQDSVAREPDAATKQSVFTQLFLPTPTSDMPDLIAVWGDQVASLKLRENQVWLRVAPLAFTEAAQATLNADRDTQAAITLRATALLETGLAKHLDIPIIPFSPNQATNRMVLSFANLDAPQSFVLASADYQLNVIVKKLGEANVNVPSEGGAPQKGIAFGAAFAVQMLEEHPDGTPEVLFETVLKRVDRVVIREISGGWKLPSVHQFSRLISNFNHELASNIATPDEDWVTRSKSDKEARSSSEIAAGLMRFRNRLKLQ